MEFDEQETPQKLKTQKFCINYQQQSTMSPSHMINNNKATPKNAKCLRKTINPRTPKGQSVSYSVAASGSVLSTNNSMHSISMAVVKTPPAKRYQRVKNPFEAALAERLHLPLIASPSLFQRPNTPQMSSTQFEWTIDEVSSLNPVNVEPHETQFHDSPDPELEAKAQSAISSYFKEQQIVPSPIDCPLRTQRIILSEVNGNTPLSKPGRRIRDGATQTELTLPPILPKALEEALKPYLQPHLAGSGQELKKSKCPLAWQTDSSTAKDTSLRRKLFDMHNIIVVENENLQTPRQQLKPKLANQSGHSNSSPISINSQQHTAIVGKLSDSMDKSSLGSLSPISASDSLSPNNCRENNPHLKIRFGHFLSQLEEAEQLSPIHPPARRKPISETNRSQYKHRSEEISKNDLTDNTHDDGDDDSEHFTPERSSSPLISFQQNNIAQFSTDSFNVRISRLKMNSSKTQNSIKERINKSLTGTQNNLKCIEMDVFHDDAQDPLESTVDMDDMQISGHSSNCSSSQSDTPRGKRRSASRKNLSQSFSANWLQDEDDSDDLEMSQSLKIKELLAKKDFNAALTAMTTNSSAALGNDGQNDYQTSNNTTPQKGVTFYRADSGFNEMSQMSSCTQDSNQQQQKDLHQPQQELMVCCSTPTTKDQYNFLK